MEHPKPSHGFTSSGIISAWLHSKCLTSMVHLGEGSRRLSIGRAETEKQMKFSKDTLRWWLPIWQRAAMPWLIRSNDYLISAHIWMKCRSLRSVTFYESGNNAYCQRSKTISETNSKQWFQAFGIGGQGVLNMLGHNCTNTARIAYIFHIEIRSPWAIFLLKPCFSSVLHSWDQKHQRSNLLGRENSATHAFIMSDEEVPCSYSPVTDKHWPPVCWWEGDSSLEEELEGECALWNKQNTWFKTNNNSVSYLASPLPTVYREIRWFFPPV